MKINVLIILGALTILGCSKSSDENTANARSLRIADFSTGEPVAYAKVSLEKCSNYDLVHGCRGYSLIEVVNTDDTGEVSIPFFDRITIEAAGYRNYISKWPLAGELAPFSGGIGLFLFPECEIVLEITGDREESNAEYAFVQGCYVKDGREVSCFNGPYFYNGPEIPVTSDTTLTVNGIGDLSVTLEIYYLDMNHDLVGMAAGGTHYTPRNTKTNIAIQL